MKARIGSINLEITRPDWLHLIDQTKVKVPNPPRGKRAKYGAQPVTIDGHRFASKKEAERYNALKLFAQVGEVQWFCVQPRFLVEGGWYVADFIVCWKDNRVSIEDVKGFKTPLYRRARKQMKTRYGIEIVEI